MIRVAKILLIKGVPSGLLEIQHRSKAVQTREIHMKDYEHHALLVKVLLNTRPFLISRKKK